MIARKGSVSAMGGPMLNPSVEPRARRESAQGRRDSEGNAMGSAAGRGSFRNADHEPHREVSFASLDGGESTTSAAAQEARNQRRSIGLKRLSVNDHMKETLVNALEDVAREVGMSIETTGLEKLKDIMTEAKETGIGVSKLFQFFLLQHDGPNRRGSVGSERRGSKSSDNPAPEDSAENANPPSHEETAVGGVFKETLSSKTRADASRNSRGAKKKSMEMMPSLQKNKGSSTANSKRGSGTHTGSARGAPGSSRADIEDDPATKDGGGGAASESGWKNRLSRRSSSLEEAMVRDRQITSESFRHGLNTLGFKLTDKETGDMFRHLDDNRDGKIDLMEFTKFCLEIPSMAWKAERARRGILSGNPGVDANRELEKAARDIANEAVIASDPAEGGHSAGAAAAEAARKEPPVALGKIVFKGEKFFWRTKDLIEVVIQLNAKVGFMAVSTFHTGTLEVYPIIFIDPAKIPMEAGAIAARAKELAAKREGQYWGPAARHDAENPYAAFTHESSEEELEEDETRGRMAYIADYLLHRVSMPDEHGNILQPDVTQPGVQVNPELPSEGNNDGDNADINTRGNAGGTAKPRPGLMRRTFDEWDTLLFPKPPSSVEGAPVFAKVKKRESYLKEFMSKKGEFDDDRIKAQRLSAEAAAYTQEVSALMKKLAPLNYSASAPAILLDDQNDTAGSPRADVELNARPGSGRIVLADDISQGRSDRRGSARGSLLESQSAPVLPPTEQAAA